MGTCLTESSYLVIFYICERNKHSACNLLIEKLIQENKNKTKLQYLLMFLPPEVRSLYYC